MQLACKHHLAGGKILICFFSITRFTNNAGWALCYRIGINATFFFLLLLSNVCCLTLLLFFTILSMKIRFGANRLRICYDVVAEETTEMRKTTAWKWLWIHFSPIFLFSCCCFFRNKFKRFSWIYWEICQHVCLDMGFLFSRLANWPLSSS